MPTTALLALLAAWIVAVVSPGPDFLAVLRTAAAGSRRDGLLVAAGVVTGICCWALAAMLGISALLESHASLYLLLRYAGAAFLVWFGISALRSAARPRPAEDDPTTGGPAGAGAGVAGWRSWRLGLATNLANPKALVFFGALFASLLPAGTSTAAKAGVLVVMLAVAMAWFATVAALASTRRITALYRRGRRTLDRITGGLFVALGGALALR
ncbi:LysE family translocator [Kineococcus glutinatus]|uniref:Threonine export protein RhtC n=1 Tax=Kineococcus glutinatus TaxID=1070872 RepID=A0ABP8VNV5_9ACTN